MEIERRIFRLITTPRLNPSTPNHDRQFAAPRCIRGRWVYIGVAILAGVLEMHGQESAANPAATQELQPPAIASMPAIYIREYRVRGAKILNGAEVGKVVYPYLGPGRTALDVEQARVALEQAYKDKGYETVTVMIPPQISRGGIITMQVVENKIGRLRVNGSRYFSLEQIKKNTPSLREGIVPNFNQVTREIISLNQLPDRRVTPVMKPGVEPGTVDIDLNVKDTFPLHGSLELNNRYSADTSELRLNGSLSYNNLWQMGHSLGASFQIAPQNMEDAKVISGYYIARFPGLDALSLMLLGTKQDSNVSTLGGSAVAGRGDVLGARVLYTLPTKGDGFYHSLSFGMDYKKFDENVRFGDGTTVTPITYYPWSLNYGATWMGKGTLTELNAGLNFHFRGSGSDSQEFDEKRFQADGNYIYFRGDLGHTRDLPGGLELALKTQGQLSSQPLINNEQFAGGGLGTVRGYLESQQLGDNALFGSIELRSPTLLKGTEDKPSEWRFYAFCEGGVLTMKNPLPEQKDYFELASVGVGSRIQVWEHFNGSLDLGFPLVGKDEPNVEDMLLTFRIWAEF